MKKTLLWLAAAMFLTMISVPPVMADGDPNPTGGKPGVEKPVPIKPGN